MKMGLIGTSRITEEFLKAANLCPQVEPYVLLSRSLEHGKDFSNKHCIPHVVTNISQLASHSIDIVYVASPNALHYPQVKILLQSGKNVLLEKPFTCILKEAGELITLSRKNNLILMEAIIPIHCPNFSLLKECLNQIGTIQKVEFIFGKISSKFNELQKGNTPNIFSPQMGGGSLMDLGVYGIWLMVALFGKPENFIHTAEILPTGVDGKGQLSCTYPSFIVNITHSKISNEGHYALITGSKGSLYVENFSQMEKLYYTDALGKKTDISCIQESEKMVYELRDFTQAVVEKKLLNNSPYSLDNTLIVMDILTQARKQSKIMFPQDEE